MSATVQKKLLELANKRLQKFVSLLPRVLLSDEPDTIHDTRVYSRRLQQVLRVFFPQPHTGKARKLVRTLRKSRRSLGPCRNLDVTMAIVQKKIRAAKEDTVRDAWRQVQQDLEEKRTGELLQARQQLDQCDLMAFIKRARALLDSGDRAGDPEQSLKKTIKQGLIEWSDALDKAMQDEGQTGFHAFRIAGKRLRYALELLATMGDHSSKAKVKTLKKLQDQIGEWHDRQVLLQFVADFISRPDFLAAHPDLARALLAEMDSEKQRDEAAIAGILKDAERIRAAWAAVKVKRRAVKGNGVDKSAEPLDSRAAERSGT
jgi:CHAD domain-containing protein